ncbi:MAG: hypothetical protein K2O18_03980 [Oscillospiraceae bacterium]|nr:hypothetical protein [Oscillospiraceae bacterium]
MVEANVVREFMVGNTRIKIADNICRQKTAGDVERLLTQIAKRSQRYFSEPVSTKNDEPRKDKRIPTRFGEYRGNDSLFSPCCDDNHGRVSEAGT